MQKEKKEKRPAPGHYHTFKSQKEIEVEKKLLAQKKIKVNDRLTYLDHIEYESLQTPGVGNYNPRVLIDDNLEKSCNRSRKT